MDEDTGTVNWNSQLETILSQEGERALCYWWLHNQAQKKYSDLNTFITLPTITMSTLAGSAAIGSSSIFADIPSIANYVIGGISLSVALLNTVSSFFGWAKRSEAHRLSATAYSKVHRFMMIELALPRTERMAAKDMLKVTRDQLDRLQETAPQIPDDVIKVFKVRFGDSTPEVSKPGITNGLDPIEVYIDESITPSRLSAKLIVPESSPRISNDGRTPDTSQTSSSVRLPTVFASDSSRT